MPLPPHLQNEPHKDWPWPFKYIPRKWTAFDWGRPKLLVGHRNDFIAYPKQVKDGAFISEIVEASPKPINPPGGWQISYFPDAPWYAKIAAWYVAYSFERGKDGKFHQIRLGARHDDVDNYVNWPTFPTARRYTGEDSQNTQNWQ